MVRQEFRISRFGLEACIFFSQSDVMVEILQVLGVCGQTAQNWQVAESKEPVKRSSKVFDSFGSTNSTLFIFEMPQMRLTQKAAMGTGG